MRFSRIARQAAILLLTAHAGFAVPRLAIVSANSETSDAADLLMARLSKRNDVALVEREQIRKIVQEQSLAASQGKLIQIGQVLGADGVLLLTVHAEQVPALLEARVIAVHPGVVVLEHDYPWPLASPQDLSGLAATQFSTVFPKLDVLTKDAVPISILGLRSALKSTQAESLERELNALLYNRLMKEKEVFVLERRRLELLTTEKQFATSTNSDFWSGSYLLDGIINKEGTTSNTVTITAQLKAPETGTPLNLETSGQRDHLPEVVSSLVAQVLRGLQKKETSFAWDTVAESRQYFNEAQWMFKWGMFPEAKAATENAWALGMQTSEVAQFRVRSYVECAGNPGYCTTDRDLPKVVYVRFNTPHLRSIGTTITFAAPTQSDRVADILRAAELFSDGWRLNSSTSAGDTNWVRLATNVIQQSSEWLRYFYFTSEERSGHEDELAELRSLTREIAGSLEGRTTELVVGTTNWAWIKSTRGAFWFETPEDGANMYRQMVKSGQWPFVRTRFINHYSYQFAQNASHTSRRSEEEADITRPCLAGWKWETRKRWPQVWDKFVEELCASADPLVKVEGLYLRCSWAWASSDFADGFEQLAAYISQNREKILTAHLEEGLIRDVNTLFSRREGELGQAIVERLKRGLWSTIPGELAKSRENQNRTDRFAPYKEYFSTANDYDLHTFNRMSSEPFRPEEVQELLPLVEGFKARLNSSTGAISLALTNALAKASDENARKDAIWQFNANAHSRNFFIDSFMKRLSNTISPPPSTVVSAPVTTPPHETRPPATLAFNPANSIRPGMSNAPGAAISGIPRGPFYPGRSPAANPQLPVTSALGSIPFSNIVEVSKFFKLPQPNVKTNASFPQISLELLHTVFRDGKIVVQAGISVRPGNQVHYFVVDPDSLDFKHAIYQDDTLAFIVMAGRSYGTRLFDYHQNKIYVGLQDSVRSFDFDKQQWERIELPSAGASKPVRLQNRLFFLTDSSILERQTNGDFRVLASARRRPAQTLLDNLDNFGEYGDLSLFLNQSGTLLAVVKNDLYSLKAETNDWLRVCSIPKNVSRPFSAHDDGILVRSDRIGMQSATGLYGFYGNFETMQLLFRKSAENQFGFPGMPKDTDKPRWQLPEGVDLVNAQACIAGNDLWILTGPNFQNDSSGQPQMVETNGWNALLFRFAPDERNSGVIPLRLKIAPNYISKESPNSQYSDLRRNVDVFTPKGMVVAHSRVAGFWLIPPDELSGGQHSFQWIKNSTR